MECQQSSSERLTEATVVNPSAKHRSGMADRRLVGTVVAPIMLFCSSLIMALAWIGHLKFENWPFWRAVFCCWLLVLPEYLLNISAIRLGYRSYTGAQMASFNLCTGVVAVAIVSRFYLGEELTQRDVLGFTLMVIAMALIGIKPLGTTARAVSESR